MRFFPSLEKFHPSACIFTRNVIIKKYEYFPNFQCRPHSRLQRRKWRNKDMADGCFLLVMKQCWKLKIKKKKERKKNEYIKRRTSALWIHRYYGNYNTEELAGVYHSLIYSKWQYIYDNHPRRSAGQLACTARSEF